MMRKVAKEPARELGIVAGVGFGFFWGAGAGMGDSRGWGVRGTSVLDSYMYMYR
jgi:hypothetical protein